MRKIIYLVYIYVWVDNRTLSQKILLALEGRKMESKHWKYSCVRATSYRKEKLIS